MKLLLIIFLLFIPLQVDYAMENMKTDPVNHILAKLAYCESRNKPTAYKARDPITPSFGLFQYKESSWRYFIAKYKLFPDAEPQELMNLIWDRYSQELVTRTIIENEINWKNNWKICTKNLR